MATAENAEVPMDSHRTLAQELAARRTAAQRTASLRVWWLLALTSLWAPITVLGIALLPYMALIELSPKKPA